MAKKGISIGKIRSALYGTAKILGDVNSVKRGTVGKRITNRVTGKVTGRVGGAVSKGIMKLFK